MCLLFKIIGNYSDLTTFCGPVQKKRERESEFLTVKLLWWKKKRTLFWRVAKKKEPNHCQARRFAGFYYLSLPGSGGEGGFRRRPRPQPGGQEERAESKNSPQAGIEAHIRSGRRRRSTRHVADHAPKGPLRVRGFHSPCRDLTRGCRRAVLAGGSRWADQGRGSGKGRTCKQRIFPSVAGAARMQLRTVLYSTYT